MGNEALIGRLTSINAMKEPASAAQAMRQAAACIEANAAALAERDRRISEVERENNALRHDIERLKEEAAATRLLVRKMVREDIKNAE